MSETVRLPDGRELCYAITGDPAGPPVFYFHGWPASRLEAALAKDLPVRLIAVDRPGFGGSSPQPGRRLLDWPSDVAVLADRLGIGRCHVVGVSGGAPYAVACAAVMPRLMGVALISPVPPLSGRYAPTDKTLGPSLSKLRQLGLRRRLGWSVIAVARFAIGAGLLDPRRALTAGFSPSDAACVSLEIGLAITGSWREGLRNGVSGAVLDARIYASDWEINLASLRTPVSIWHGSADRIVLVAALSGYAALPGQRHVFDGEGTTPCR
jgi:pimeloyl-ACP methyl ester carboxylesterase